MRVFLGFFVLFLSFFMFVAEQYGVQANFYGYFLYFLSIMLIGSYLAVFVRKKPDYIFSSFYQIYSFGILLAASILIANGAWMLEIQKEGTTNGAYWVSLFWLVLVLESGYVGYKFGVSQVVFKRDLVIKRNIVKLWIFLLILIVVIVGCFIFYKYSGPFFLPTDRVNYWRSYVPFYFQKYPSLLGQSFFFVAFYYFYSKNDSLEKKVFVFFIFSYLSLTVLVSGEKFSTFILYLSMWFILKRGFSKSGSISLADFKIIFWSFLLLSSLVGSIYFVSEKGFLFIFDRIALQGQLLWSVLNEDVSRLIIGESWNCFLGCEGFKSGADWISERYLPKETYNLYSSIGTVLSGFYPALLVLNFGFPVSIVFSIFFSILLGFLQSKVILACRGRDIISAFLYFKILLGLLVFWYASKIFVLNAVVIVAILLVLYKVIIRSFSPIQKVSVLK